MEGLIWTSPCLVVVVKFPFAVEIFLLLGHEEYVEKYLGDGVIWSVAPESSIQ